MSSAESNHTIRAILEANAAFYRAFTRGDYAAMAELWARATPVTCFHPGSSLLIGREAVLASWREVLAGPPPFVMRCDHARVQRWAEVALVTCYEGNGELPAHLAATNVFVLEQDRWHMLHHQAGPLSRPLPAPSRATAN